MMEKVTVIIPAYNEESSIRKTLKPYCVSSVLEKINILVVCNGCKDNTALIVRNEFPQISLIELCEGSKVKAINRGLDEFKQGTVIIQDADIEMSTESIENLIYALLKEDFILASPTPKLHWEDSSILVKLFHQFLEATPEYKRGMVSSGVYCISEAGRKELGKLPENCIADDGYVKARLANRGFLKVDNAITNVFLPLNIKDLIKIKTRSRLGNMLLKKIGLNPSTGKNNLRSLIKIALKEWKLIQFSVYLSVNVISRVRAKKQFNTNSLIWERDESSRSN